MIDRLNAGARACGFVTAAVLVLAFLMAGTLCVSEANATPADWSDVTREMSKDSTAQRLLKRAKDNLKAKPRAMKRLVSAGLLPGEGIHDQSELAMRDFALMRDAALAWRLSGEEAYLKQVDSFLRSWVSVYAIRYNPIDENQFDGLIQAYILTKGALPQKTREATDKFLRTMATGYIERTETRRDEQWDRDSGTWINNWQSHRLKLMAFCAAALNDREMLREVNRLFLQHIANNVRQDGSVFDFEVRDAIHYVVYDLEPLTMAAIAAKPFGYDWLNAPASNGATLKSALEWLVPYAKGEKTHEEYVKSTIEFDKKRADAGLEGYSGQWKPRTADELFWQASMLDPSYRPLAQKLAYAPYWVWVCSLQ